MFITEEEAQVILNAIQLNKYEKQMVEEDLKLVIKIFEAYPELEPYYDNLRKIYDND